MLEQFLIALRYYEINQEYIYHIWEQFCFGVKGIIDKQIYKVRATKLFDPTCIFGLSLLYEGVPIPVFVNSYLISQIFANIVVTILSLYS